MIEFNTDHHEYRMDGAVVPHVTQVTDALSSYAGVSWEILERKREIGEAVHYATELDDAGDLDLASIPDAIRGYVEAWQHFRAATGFLVIESESRVWSSIYRYGGTLDRVGTFTKFRGIKPRQLCLIDIKTTYDILPACGPQLAAYMQAWNEHADEKIERRFIAQLKQDATYRMEEFRESSDWTIFLAALTLHNWKQRHNLGESA